MVAKHGGSRIAGNQANHHEDNDRHADEYRDHLDQASNDIPSASHARILAKYFGRAATPSSLPHRVVLATAEYQVAGGVKPVGRRSSHPLCSCPTCLRSGLDVHILEHVLSHGVMEVALDLL